MTYEGCSESNASYLLQYQLKQILRKLPGIRVMNVKGTILKKISI